jgi:transcriptional regulator with XRE-family HTH domain
MPIATIAPEVKEARKKCGWSQENIASETHVTRQMIQMIEHGKRRFTEEDTAKLARLLNDGEFAMILARRVTGGMAAPYLNNVDNHRLACVMKLLEELREAADAVTKELRLVIRAQSPANLAPEEREQIESMMLEICEEVTASQNTLARLAKTYGISLAGLWDRHEAELVRKGYLKVGGTVKC